MTPKHLPVSIGRAYALLFLTMAIWASSFAGIRFVLRELDPFSMTTIRLLFAALCMALVIPLLKLRLPARRDWPRFVGASLLGMSIYHFLLNVGTETITAGQASFIIATIPIWTALLAARFLSEDLTKTHWAGLGLGVLGVGIMSLDADVGGLGAPGPGSWYVLGSAIAAGINIVLCKDLLLRYRAIEIAIYTTVIGALPFVFHLPWTIPASQDISMTAWVVLFYLGAVPIGLGYWMSSIALAALPASRTSQMMLLVPPMAALIAWFAIGEEPSKMLFIGGPMIVAGVLLGRRKAPEAPEAPDQNGQN